MTVDERYERLPKKVVDCRIACESSLVVAVDDQGVLGRVKVGDRVLPGHQNERRKLVT